MPTGRSAAVRTHTRTSAAGFWPFNSGQSFMSAVRRYRTAFPSTKTPRATFQRINDLLFIEKQYISFIDNWRLTCRTGYS